ncbi:unnamed protein product [Acanthoscelides obtectus]|uniref:Tc1-like transposase DDE domain-containing protein n=1 Tax=Acanthoscelides obtectus TaxID=200917 RepID=A0A9P0PL95_ACAOB|nr:unnamed protein product [Acanthoscelides obtectus]CAK1626727.1 Transposable element Tc3 transposase [Acanthoscelides obtectus]
MVKTISVVIDTHKVNAGWCRQRSLWDQEWNIRRRRGERRNPQFFVERHVHHTVGVMVWGAIAYGFRSPLIFIRGNMNAQRYIHEVLEPHLLPYLDTLADPTFQQDNARPHVARVTIDFFQHNDVALLPWPPRSPDLSPIEHVWDMMGKRLLNLQPLREALVVAWNEIPQEDIDHLIRSMPRRVGECIAHQVFGNEAPHQSTISRWYGEFKRGRVSRSDDSRENVDAVRKLIIEDRKQPGGDESWIYCYEPENKRQSAVWVFQGEEKPTKVIRSRSVSKKMVATFASKAGHIATIPLNEQRTVTADWYTTICFPKVITELQKINPERRRIILHQHNASSHTAQKTTQYLTEENVELLYHPPYSPDLSPNDFFTFPKIKSRLRGQRFQSPEEAVDAFKNAVLDLPANEWNKCFENWFERMQMCTHLRGEQ